MPKIDIDPITRVEGHMGVTLQVEGGRVVDAWVHSDLFRGLEIIFQNRDPRDMPYFTQRICGFCPISHAVASSYALWDANHVEVPRNGHILRNMLLAADYLMDHIRHMYFLVFPDFVKMPDIAPLIPHPTTDYRIPKAENDALVQHYLDALDVQRHADTMVAVWGGKSPHTHGVYPGGASLPVTADRVMKYLYHARELLDFINSHMVPDMETIAKYYPDHYKFGKGVGNLISYGLYQQSDRVEDRIFLPGVYVDGEKRPLNLADLRNGITEDITHARYRQDKDAKPPLEEETNPDPRKADAYTWVKAPRFEDRVMETGPLARMIIKGNYTHGISMMDRQMARVLETKMIAEMTIEWTKELDHAKPYITPWPVPKEGTGVGLVDAVRGALGHWVHISNYKVAKYQVITPTVWNNSPRDAQGRRGALEEALVGTPIADPASPIEAIRVIHSFDPCNDCAVQVITPQGPLPKFKIY